MAFSGKIRELTITAFEKACETECGSPAQQNTIMRKVSIDIVELIETIWQIKHPAIPKPKSQLKQPKTLADVVELVTEATARARIVAAYLEAQSEEDNAD